MKNFIKIIMIFSMVSLLGCTKTLYTHDEVLGRYKTRDDVQKTFGVPTEKQLSDTSERWLYQFDRHDALNRHSVELHHNIQTTTVNEFNKYDRYLLFSFDRTGNVIRCDYTGVDLTVKKKDTGGTIALAAICAGVIVGAIALASSISFPVSLNL